MGAVAVATACPATCELCPASTTTTTTATAVTTTDGAGCLDSPAGWVDVDGDDCDKYQILDWCTPDGGYGVGWGDPSTNPGFEEFAVDGIAATDACCGCGGGFTAIAELLTVVDCPAVIAADASSIVVVFAVSTNAVKPTIIRAQLKTPTPATAGNGYAFDVPRAEGLQIAVQIPITAPLEPGSHRIVAYTAEEGAVRFSAALSSTSFDVQVVATSTATSSGTTTATTTHTTVLEDIALVHCPSTISAASSTVNVQIRVSTNARNPTLARLQFKTPERRTVGVCAARHGSTRRLMQLPQETPTCGACRLGVGKYLTCRFRSPSHR